MPWSLSDAEQERRQGRPATDFQMSWMTVRMFATTFATLAPWISSQAEDGLSRPEAIRRLINLGLTLVAKSDDPGCNG